MISGFLADSLRAGQFAYNCRTGRSTRASPVMRNLCIAVNNNWVRWLAAQRDRAASYVRARLFEGVLYAGELLWERMRDVGRRDNELRVLFTRPIYGDCKLRIDSRANRFFRNFRISKYFVRSELFFYEDNKLGK